MEAGRWNIKDEQVELKFKDTSEKSVILVIGRTSLATESPMIFIPYINFECGILAAQLPRQQSEFVGNIAFPQLYRVWLH